MKPASDPTFENTVSFFNSPTYTNQPADSPYDDNSASGFVEMGTDLIPMNTLKGLLLRRRGQHPERLYRGKWQQPALNLVHAG